MYQAPGKVARTFEINRESQLLSQSLIAVKCPTLPDDGNLWWSNHPRLGLYCATKFPTPITTTLVKPPIVARPPPPRA